eukprot:Sspe_Gene.17554::Locus_6235_Transcript_1_1_Confidence_1.000_Length_3101::g.17554::m.17554
MQLEVEHQQLVEDVNTLFQAQTVDQVRQTLANKRKESEAQQRQLRQLVGDRYKDLLSASDMIMEMGTVCDDLVKAFDESCQSRRRRRHSDTQPPHVQPPQPCKGKVEWDIDVRQEVRKVSQCLQQIRAWLDEGHYLEATLALKQCRETVGRLQELEALASRELEAAAKGKRVEKAPSYLSQHIAKWAVQLNELPDAIIEHTASAIADSRCTPSSLIAVCCKSLASVAALFDCDLQKALTIFTTHRMDTFHRLLTNSSDGKASAAVAVTMLYAVKSFLHQVFVTRAASFASTLTLCPTALVDSGIIAAVPQFQDFLPHLTADSFYDSSKGFSSLPTELPPVDQVQRLLASWNDEAFGLVQKVLHNSLDSLQTVEDCVMLQRQLMEQCRQWRGEDLGDDTPPTRWEEVIQGIFAQRLTTLLGVEMKHFLEHVQHTLAKYREVAQDGVGESLEGMPGADEQQLAKRYTLESHGQAKPEALRDPSLPQPIVALLDQFNEGLLKAMSSVEMCRTCLPAPAKAGEVFCSSLEAITRLVQETAKELGPGFVPLTGLVVQGMTRLVAHAVKEQKDRQGKTAWVGEGVVPGKLSEYYAALNTTYLNSFSSWIESTVAEFMDVLQQGTEATYWGPDKITYERTVSSSWEHQEVKMEGDDVPMSFSLPSSPSPTLMQALQGASTRISQVLPSLLRKGVVEQLHDSIADRAFTFYSDFIRQGRQGADSLDNPPPICQSALWQLLFDIRFLAAVISSDRHRATPGGKALSLAMSTIMDCEIGIDPVDYKYYTAHIDELLGAAVDSVLLLYATHMTRSLPGARTITRKATHLEFAPECERFPTLHLAQLQTTSPSLPISTPVSNSSMAVSRGRKAESGILGTSMGSGLQQLQAIGTGLQQQLKGMKFSW